MINQERLFVWLRTFLAFNKETGSNLNTVRLTVRGELAEPPAANSCPFDKLRDACAAGVPLERVVRVQ